jgi:hypothetical protein
MCPQPGKFVVIEEDDWFVHRKGDVAVTMLRRVPSFSTKCRQNGTGIVDSLFAYGGIGKFKSGNISRPSPYGR